MSKTPYIVAAVASAVILGIALYVTPPATITATAARSTGIVCPESVKKYPNLAGLRNADLHIRQCWPGMAHCHCDADNDCYAEPGYVRCVPKTATTTDAGQPPQFDAGQPRDVAPPQPPQFDAGQPRDVAPPFDAGQPRDTAPPVDLPRSDALTAFPGAEGFGAPTTGGRGGRVIYVTNLNSSGAGSLASALMATGPRYILFSVSGVISGTIHPSSGNFTLAGQTSPGGITLLGGLICDNVYDPNNCRNVIIRNMRFRNPGDDCVRLGGTDHVILDHVSLENAGDESLEISRSHDITVQYSLIAEPIGPHFNWGGLLLNYSKGTMYLDNISIHHTVWNGVRGRLPELSCEENGDGPVSVGASNCSGRTLHIELTNNVFFDVFDPIWYNRCTGTNQGNDCAPSARDFGLALNMVNVVRYTRSTVDPFAMVNGDIARSLTSGAYYNGNLSFRGTAPITTALAIPSRPSRFAYPAISLQPAAGLVAQLQRAVGAFPRDPMDTRILGYLSNPVDARPAAWNASTGIDRGDRSRVVAGSWTVPVDTDRDGMPDAWEAAHGGDLETYLNELAAQVSLSAR